jgi:undecaprenyl-phosphate galactose phosphotransferase/putative colanic acid biosynthesis UDP-glucose lipid carrier transferase
MSGLASYVQKTQGPLDQREVSSAHFITFPSFRTIRLAMVIVDFLIINLASILGGFAYNFLVFGSIVDLGRYIAVGTNAAVLFVLFTQQGKLYSRQKVISTNRQLQGVALNWSLSILLTMALLFMLKSWEAYSRGSAIVFVILSFGLLSASRVAIANMIRSAMNRGMLTGVRTLVIGDSHELDGLSDRELLEKYDARAVARLELPTPLNAFSSGDADGWVHSAAAAASRTGVEQVFLALRWDDVRRRETLCSELRLLPLSVFLLPDRALEPLIFQTTQQMGAGTVFEIQRAPLSITELVGKRLVDLVLASTALLMLLPLLILVGIAVKIDSRGPVIFRQRRNGFNGREFRIYKFRSMTVLEDGDAIKQATRNDKRVTRLGQILRMTSIDELPQLINVLRGEMSLVGPRPHAIAHDNEYAKSICNYAFRHHVKPGITGWAQVHGMRGETPNLEVMEKRITLDIWYINNWSIWLDLRILAMTTLEVIGGKSAY